MTELNMDIPSGLPPEDKESENTTTESENPDAKSAESTPRHVKTTLCRFDSMTANRYYTQHHYLPPESGISNYIDPVHEYKAFTNTENATTKDKKMKFCNEVFRFAAGCMNARTNGTIHFGVQDKPHGEIIGVQVEDCATYVNYIDQMMKEYFEEIQLHLAKQCIRPPRFVLVLYQNNTTSDLFVIEIDIVPAHMHCASEIFHTFEQVFKDNSWKKSKEKCCFLRDGASTKNILARVQHNLPEYISFINRKDAQDKTRKTAEDGQRRVKEYHEHGSRLGALLTANRDTLCNSYYQQYILVVNKSQEIHKKNIDFMHEVPWLAVLDFDPESETSGLYNVCQEKWEHGLHNLSQNQKLTLKELELSQTNNWFHCNGKLESQDHKPLSYKKWHEDKAADVRQLVTFLSRKKKTLIVFLLLSPVEDPLDPMNEVFWTFYQELHGMTDIMCICEGEETYRSWEGLHAKLVDKETMEERCIFSLNFEEVNGTILKLKLDTQRRFLPSHGGSSTLLHSEEESLGMSSLYILCANECHGTEIEFENNETEFREFIETWEERFCKGGKATWWNFYFSQKKYTGTFIKRDIHEKLKEQIEKCRKKHDNQKGIKNVTLFHHPGCGGTTTAMHVLWELRDTFRCATLKINTKSFATIAEHIINLAVSGPPHKEYFPVLLLVDNLDEFEENMSSLEQCISSEISKRHLKVEVPVVIILNCTRSWTPEQRSKHNRADSVFLTYKLSLQEQRAFERKLKETEEKYEKPHDFYSFMIMKSNVKKTYFEEVVKNIFEGFNNMNKQQSQLISILALLNKYEKDSTLSLCNKILAITENNDGCWGEEGIKESLGAYSTIMFHPLIAEQCIEELMNEHYVSQSSILLGLIDTNIFYRNIADSEKLSQSIQSMLVKCNTMEYDENTDTLFSPLINEIHKHEGNKRVETVLKAGREKFVKNPYICQALARHFYVRRRHFHEAVLWAKEAMKIQPQNGMFVNTLLQIYKTQIRTMVDSFNKDNPVSGAALKKIIEVFEMTFRECGIQKENNKTEGTHHKRIMHSLYDFPIYNTAIYLGVIEASLYTLEILLKIPWLNVDKDANCNTDLMAYLTDKCVYCNEHDLCDFLSHSKIFFIELNTLLKNRFDFIQDYFVFLSVGSLNERTEFKIKEKVSEHYEKYASRFLNNTPIHGFLPNSREHLQLCKEGRFSGILESVLLSEKQLKTKADGIIRAITIYEHLHQNDKSIMSDTQNYILANIVLHCISPKLTQIASLETLKLLLQKALQRYGAEYNSPEPFYLASLLFWPHNIHQLDSDSQNIAAYINCMRQTFQHQYQLMRHGRVPISHFYLGKGNGLERLMHKAKINSFLSVSSSDIKSLWQNGDIWKENAVKQLLLPVTGRTENNIIYVECEGAAQIPVMPDPRQSKTVEQNRVVNFYLGFSMYGPIAYNIKAYTQCP